jgi:exopolysaccharide biosynthesis polyprenyl glycosylphosphotransferase
VRGTEFGLSACLTYILRFKTFVSLRPVIYQISFDKYILSIALIALSWLIIFVIAGLYNIGSRHKFTTDVGRIFLACTTGIMLVIVFIFFQRELLSSRFIVLAGWLMAFIFILIERLVVRLIRQVLFKKGIGIQKIILIGNHQTGEEIAKTIYKNPTLGYQVLERIKDITKATPEYLKNLWENNLGEIDEIIQMETNIDQQQELAILDFCDEHNIIFRYAADLFNTQTSNIAIDTIAGVPIIEIKRTPLDGWGKIIKRFFDILLSTIGLILLSPFFIIMATIIKLDSAGPVFVKLDRIGQKHKKFELLKFRSMVKNAAQMKQDLMYLNERSGPLFKIKDDPRVTRVGRFIRRTSIDELPQLWNVLRGEMSLVGPRPHEPQEVSKYEKHHKRLLGIKPGITGMAQISGRSDLNFEDEYRLDIFYIENWSLGLDLRILFKTLPVVLSKKSAC